MLHSLQHAAGSDDTNFDVIVLGVGSMGASACFHLANAGIRVLGLEQFNIPHELGSHAGQSRIIRKAYFEHPDYVPLLERAYHNWANLEAITGTTVLYKTGLLYFSRPAHPLVHGVRQSAAQYGIPVNTLSTTAVSSQHPRFSIPGDYDCLFEPDAGFVTPERAILLYTKQALSQGAVIRTNEQVLEWNETSSGVTVTTNKGRYTAAKLVITAGPWAGKMIPGMAPKLQVTRQLVAWVKPKQPAAFSLGNFPCWTLADDAYPGIFYGFPMLPEAQFGGPAGLKIAHHAKGMACDPDKVNRVPGAEEEAVLQYALNKYIPDAYEATLTLKTCLYTYSPDENFIIDFLPGSKHVVIAAGFSGHGFKFASVVGEILSDLAVKGATALPIGFLSASRFA